MEMEAPSYGLLTTTYPLLIPIRQKMSLQYKLQCFMAISTSDIKRIFTHVKNYHNFDTDYLQDLFPIRTTKYDVRNLEMKLNLPKPNTNYLKKSLSYRAASLWNNLPNNLRMIESLRSFKREANRFYENEG